MSKSWRDKSQVLASDQLEKRKLQAQVKKDQTKNQDFYLQKWHLSNKQMKLTSMK